MSIIFRELLSLRPLILLRELQLLRPLTMELIWMSMRTVLISSSLMWATLQSILQPSKSQRLTLLPHTHNQHPIPISQTKATQISKLISIRAIIITNPRLGRKITTKVMAPTRAITHTRTQGTMETRTAIITTPTIEEVSSRRVRAAIQTD